MVPAEIIIADGGPDDKTRQIAINKGCRVVESRVRVGAFRLKRG